MLRHRTSALQQEVVLRILPHGPVQELDPAPEPLQLLQEHHQMDVVARQTIGIGDQHPTDAARPHGIAQPVQAGPVQRRPAAPVIPEDGLACQLLALPAEVGAQAPELLLDGLGLRLARAVETRTYPLSSWLTSCAGGERAPASISAVRLPVELQPRMSMYARSHRRAPSAVGCTCRRTCQWRFIGPSPIVFPIGNRAGPLLHPTAQPQRPSRPGQSQPP